MHSARPFALLAVAAAMLSAPAFAQNAPSQDGAAAMAASNTYSSLRDNLADQSTTLGNDVARQRAILKKNQELLKEAQRLDAVNKKMIAERQHMLQQNAELERQRAALAQTQAQIEAPAEAQGTPQAQPQSQAKPASQDVALAKANPGDSK